jgi:hypothetical protein
MVVRHATREKRSLEHMDWREEAMHMTERGCGLKCCCLVAAGSRNHRQDQTSGVLEVEAGTKLRGQAVVASQKQQVSRGKLTGLKCEGRMAELALRQELKQA